MATAKAKLRELDDKLLTSFPEEERVDECCLSSEKIEELVTAKNNAS